MASPRLGRTVSGVHNDTGSDERHVNNQSGNDRSFERPHPRALSFDGMPNVRDLGGINLRGGGVVDCGKVIRSASPQFLTEAGARQLHAYGVRTVIDLRSPKESESEGIGHLQHLVDTRELTHVLVPIMSDEERDIDPIGSSEGVDDAARHYVNYLRSAGRFVTIIETVIDTAAAGGATLLHCALGKDRTGVVASVILDAVGAEHDHIVDDYALTARHVPHMVNRLATSPSYQRDFTTPNWASLAPQPHGIAGMLTWLGHAHDGAAGYLRTHGLTAERLQQLRDLLRYLPAARPAR